MATIEEEIAAVEGRLTELKNLKRAQDELLRESIVPVYKYTFAPVGDGYGRFTVGGDHTWWRLSGEVQNEEQLRSVGRSVNNGGMNYLRCDLTGRFVLQDGGGVIFLTFDHRGSFSERNEEGWEALEDFAEQNPDGGDVTEIVERYRYSS